MYQRWYLLPTVKFKCALGRYFLTNHRAFRQTYATVRSHLIRGTYSYDNHVVTLGFFSKG